MNKLKPIDIISHNGSSLRTFVFKWVSVQVMEFRHIQTREMLKADTNPSI